MQSLRWDIRVFAAAAVLATLVSPAGAQATAPCGSSGYSYAGVASTVPARGISATVTLLDAPRVESGHVAAWVGVGGYGVGPGGSDEWIQVGLSALPGSLSRIYVEWKRPGARRRYVQLGGPVRPGEARRLAVFESSLSPQRWQVWVDGRPVGRPILLPRSRGGFQPIATAESWDGGRPACNRYAYRFSELALFGVSGSWSPLRLGFKLEDPGYRVVRRSPANFVARVRR